MHMWDHQIFTAGAMDRPDPSESEERHALLGGMPMESPSSSLALSNLDLAMVLSPPALIHVSPLQEPATCIPEQAFNSNSQDINFVHYDQTSTLAALQLLGGLGQQIPEMFNVDLQWPFVAEGQTSLDFHKPHLQLPVTASEMTDLWSQTMSFLIPPPASMPAFGTSETLSRPQPQQSTCASSFAAVEPLPDVATSSSTHLPFVTPPTKFPFNNDLQVCKDSFKYSALAEALILSDLQSPKPASVGTNTFTSTASVSSQPSLQSQITTLPYSNDFGTFNPPFLPSELPAPSITTYPQPTTQPNDHSESPLTCNAAEPPTQPQTRPKTRQRGSSANPYLCPYPGCTSTFARKAHLASHAVSHSNIKNFPCTVCGLPFARSQDLKKHSRSEHALPHGIDAAGSTDGKKYHKCLDCGALCKRIASFVRHRQDVCAAKTFTFSMEDSFGYAKDDDEEDNRRSIQPSSSPVPSTAYASSEAVTRSPSVATSTTPAPDSKEWFYSANVNADAQSPHEEQRQDSVHHLETAMTEAIVKISIPPASETPRTQRLSFHDSSNATKPRNVRSRLPKSNIDPSTLVKAAEFASSQNRQPPTLHHAWPSPTCDRQLHRRTHLTVKKEFSCDICGVEHSRKQELKRHLKIQHGFGAVVGAGTATILADDGNRGHASDTSFLTCPHCGVLCRRKFNMRIHVNRYCREAERKPQGN
ncbi:hypothetical protein HDU97_006454 [Phlyctochytrium planicorne]|nr:hypothetical protein HDU97_006454 [Phlyctochytrium planicorne]